MDTSSTLASAPIIFIKLMKPVIGLLRRLGMNVIIYVDDILILAKTFSLTDAWFQNK